ncbi:hypothetical protein [Halovivax cerinus]|uniref:Uncharacterized protein n=1 Tax=Halovivax cerinus TaxID=1487865 RepID=A0ABD5NKG7_9EURY|nr:hypothetical protein [Halovivax cerinus]
MSALFESDQAFYYAIGASTFALFLVGLGVLALLNPDGIGTHELGGFVVGFGLFMVSYVVAMVVYRFVPGDADSV